MDQVLLLTQNIEDSFEVKKTGAVFHSFIHFILFSIIIKQFNTKNPKYLKDQEKEEAAQRQTKTCIR